MAKSDDGDDTNYFSVSKYGRDKGVKQDTLVDPTDAYANYHQYMISFMHLATSKTVYFKAFVTEYNETFASGWTPTAVYGRTDPIQNFTGNSRTISLTFGVPASSMGEAYENLGRISKLVQMLYPTYIPNEESSGYIIGQAPLVRVKMMNMITKERLEMPEPDSETGEIPIRDQKKFNAAMDLFEGRASPAETLNKYKTSPLPENGVLSAITSLSYRSDLSKIQIFEKGANTILPQSYTVTLSFNVIHEETIGWDSSGNALAETFPHKVKFALPQAQKMKIINNEQNYADIQTRIDQEKQNQAEEDAKEAMKNKFLEKLMANKIFGSNY